MTEISTSYSGGRAVVAACMAAAKVWGDEAQFAGFYRATTVEGPKDWHLYPEDTLLRRSITFRFHRVGAVEIRMLGRTSRRFAGGAPTILWEVLKAKVLAWKYSRREGHEVLVHLVTLKPEYIGLKSRRYHVGPDFWRR